MRSGLKLSTMNRCVLGVNYSLLYTDYYMKAISKDTLINFYMKHRRMPGYKELMQITGYKSKRSVHVLINKLVDQGILFKNTSGQISPAKNLFGTKMLGVVEAGFPSPAEEELLDIMSFDDFLTPNKESTYILKVKGDSMIDAGICEGDMVIVERKHTYKQGQIVIALIDGGYTMKYLRKRGDDFYLEPANTNYKNIYPKDTLTIEAVVTGVVRKY